jgi:hypothetical protein
MLIQKYLYRIKINDEVKQYIDVLKKHNIKTSSIIRKAMLLALKEKCNEIKVEIKKAKTPF